MTNTTAGPILHLIRRLATDQRLRELPDQLGQFLPGLPMNTTPLDA